MVGPKWYLGTVVLVLLAAACNSSGGAAESSTPAPVSEPPVTSTPPSTSPDVRAEGPVFVDSSGNTVVLRGVAVHTLDPVTYQQAAGLDANFVRLAVSWSDYEPQAPVGSVHNWDEARLADLDAEIAYFRQHGIQVLLDVHQYGWSPYFASLQRGGMANGIPAWVYQHRRFPLTTAGLDAAQARMYTDRRTTNLYADFVSMLAQRYRETPNVVGYEVLNEPPLGNLPRKLWAIEQIVRWQARVGAAVRAVDPERAIVFMVPPRTDLRALQLAPLERLGRIAFDVHDYYAGTGKRYRTTLQGGRYSGTFANQRSYLAPAVAMSRAWGVPLIVGEWGAFPDEQGVDRYQRQMVNLFGQDGISWARWSLDRNERLGLLERDGQPTQAAEQLRRLLRSMPDQPS